MVGQKLAQKKKTRTPAGAWLNETLTREALLA